MYKAVITYTKSPGQMARELRRAVKDENAATIQRWHRVFLPKHFQSGAMERYRLGKRTRDYEKRKQRKTGRLVPLVFTGTLKREAERSIRVTSTSKGGRGVMSVPRYAFFKQAGRKRRIADEMVAITKEEVETLAREHGENVAKRLDKPAPERKPIG
jgi:hypothetical protein